MLSIVVIFHNMVREAERTLYSLSANYQSGVTNSEYEVIAIDNGSGNPLNAEQVEKFESAFSYHFFETASVSPAAAVNHGARLANGDHLVVIVDGARMVTPGIVNASLRSLQSYPNPFVIALAFHLGPDVQNASMLQGYDQAEEDRLLKTINWRRDGYRLFEIATLAQSSASGFFGGTPAECSWFAMPRLDFLDLGGFDEQFQTPGGGLINHDFLHRAMQQDDITPVILLGEGTFHQFHGGVATNVPMADHPMSLYQEEYETIRGRPYYWESSSPPFYTGAIRRAAMKFMEFGDARGTQDEERVGGTVSYLDVLDRLHRELCPAHYLEIGVRHGKSLILARGPATGVDPAPDVKCNLPSEVNILPITSDDFFADPPDELEPDFCFIDGLHHFECALRDFMNVERHAAPGAVVAIDDVFPNHFAQAERKRRTQVWTGDVWQLIEIFKKYRSDLGTLLLDVAPTGMLLIRGLDPSNRVLWENYDKIVRRTNKCAKPPQSILERHGAIQPTDEQFSRFFASIKRDQKKSEK